MQLFTLHSLALCLLCATWTALALPSPKGIVKPGPEVEVAPRSSSPSYEVNLRSGVTSSTLPPGITWHSPLTQGQGSCVCDLQGVLKLTFSPERKRAEIRMTFEESQGWTFNVGDSVTNNGYAGDSGTQDNDAEVHSLHNTLYFYGRDNPSGGSYGLLHSQPGFVGVQPYSTLTLDIADQLARADNGLHTVYLNSPKLFALSGQSDASPGGVNRDVYLGMNRVVGGTFRQGQGLCRVSVRFFPS